MIHESTKTTRKTLARDGERQRRRELEEQWNRVKRRTMPPRFEIAADQWLEHAKPHLAPRTYEIYEVAIRCHLSLALGSVLLCDIDPDAISAYQASRKADGASARTLNKELQVMRQILKRHKLWANLQGDVKFEQELDNIGKALTSDEETKLLAACESNALLHTIVSVALNTALRKNEIRLLRWSDIDLFNRTLTVGRAKTEGGSGRVIPLNAVAYTALVRWAERFADVDAKNYIFPSCENARIDTARPSVVNIIPQQPIKSWRTAWRRVVKDAGLEIRFHDLRHCCITKLAEGHASEQTIMAIAGHLSRKMLEHYSHIRMAAKRTALDNIVPQSQSVNIQAGVNQNVHQHTSAESGVPTK